MSADRLGYYYKIGSIISLLEDLGVLGFGTRECDAIAYRCAVGDTLLKLKSTKLRKSKISRMVTIGHGHGLVRLLIDFRLMDPKAFWSFSFGFGKDAFLNKTREY